MQQAEEAATEAESERVARLGFELEARIVDAQLRQCVAEFFEVLTV